VTNNDIDAVLRTATAQAGLNAEGAELIRLGENALYRLPGKVVARITRPGQHTAAVKEVNVARWLQDGPGPIGSDSTGSSIARTRPGGRWSGCADPRAECAAGSPAGLLAAHVRSWLTSRSVEPLDGR
jgi:hypothetical protein